MTSSKPKAPTNRLIVGYTTKQHLLLDIDDRSLTQVERLTELIMESFPEVGDALILESSQPYTKSYRKYLENHAVAEIAGKPSYHVVFDNIIGYKRILEIIETLTGLDVLEPIFKWVRLFRNDMTLRVSPEWLSYRTKPAPKPIKAIINDDVEKKDGMAVEYWSVLSAAAFLTSLQGDA